jgi:putative transposase
MTNPILPPAAKQHVRNHPHHEVIIKEGQPNIVFLTVCTKDRVAWLACQEVHDCLVSVWRDARAWHVGRYILRPDHLHLFASPGTPELSLERWVQYWKSQFSKRHKQPAHRWQADHWDTTLRDTRSYDEKWEYVVSNSVRHKLVERAEDWPLQGELFELRWL